MYNQLHSRDDLKTSLLPKSNNIHDISDNRVRYTSLGIVNMVHPLKVGQIDKKHYYVIYDSVEQNMIVFDIDTIYERYIQKGIEYIDTSLGKYRLTPKTVQDIVLLKTQYH